MRQRSDERALVLNLVWTGRSFRLMRTFTDSLVEHTGARLRFVANACPPDEIERMEGYATSHPDRVAEVLEVSAERMLAHGEALDRVLAQRDDGDLFAFLDPDIIATAPFLEPMLALLTEHGAVTSGTELWSDSNVQPADHLGVGVGGRHFFSPDGFTYGSPHLALYRRDALVDTMDRWKVGLGSAGPDLGADARRRVDELGLMHAMFDTGKLVNILFQADGHSLVHTEHPALLHIGGLSHYVAPERAVEGADGTIEPPWVHNPAVRDRADVARYTARALEAQVEGRPLPDPPAEEDGRLGDKLATVHRALAGAAVDTDATSDGYADEAFQTAFEEHVARNDFLTVTHTRQVTSFGGTGTTAVCNHLMDRGVDLQRGPAHWPFKHLRTPPTADEVPEGFRVLYLVGDPRNAVLSLFRRDYQVGHVRAMHLDWRELRARQQAGLPLRDPSAPRSSPVTLARLVDLQTYLSAGVDEFGFEDHLDRWLAHPPGYPVMIVRYLHLGEVWDEVCDFLGSELDPLGWDTDHRSSHWDDLPRHLRAPLDRMYGDLWDRIQAMPPCQIV